MDGAWSVSAADGGSLFGGYTAPKPGSLLFAAAPAFGAPAKQSAAGGDGDEDDAEGGAEGADGGEAVFGGPDTAPVVQLSEVPKQTGEEDEDVLYSGARCALSCPCATRVRALTSVERMSAR